MHIELRKLKLLGDLAQGNGLADRFWHIIVKLLPLISLSFDQCNTISSVAHDILYGSSQYPGCVAG